MLNKITVVIPVKNPPNIDGFILANNKLLTKYRIIVIDSGGGEKLKVFTKKYYKLSLPLPNARSLGISMVKTPFTLNLDSDVILPKDFISNALKKLEDKDTIVVSIEYEKIQGHLPFGPSLWKTEWLQKLYDWRGWTEKMPICECIWMWNRVHEIEKNIETLCMRAKHLKGI